MMTAGNAEFFKRKKGIYQNELARSKRRLQFLSWIRVIVFVALLVSLVYFINQSEIYPALVTGGVQLVLFLWAVKLHGKEQFKANHLRFLTEINEEELDRFDNRFGRFYKGDKFNREDHPYAIDLDIFGDNSLFQLLNRSCTEWGLKTLAAWLSGPAVMEEIKTRQDSVNELLKDPDWLQHFQATGRHYRDKKDARSFIEWLHTGNVLLGSKFYEVIRFILPVVNILLLWMVLFRDLNFIYPVVSMTISAMVLLNILNRVNKVHQNTSNGIATLRTVEALIALVEGRKFMNQPLLHIQDHFIRGSDTASRRIGQLKFILEQLDNRSNVFYQIINVGLLLDIHLTLGAEKWKWKAAGSTSQWFDTLGHMESLISLSGFAFANPDFNDPVIGPDRYRIEARSIGHPLILAAHRVSNDFILDGKGAVAMITGSNMAGKSTFLRTVGINLVLAYAGAKVCAENLHCGIIQVFTSMRTQDNLAENVSSFYAELKRIRQLIEYTESGKDILFLLDEILKGTNSKDRHIGAVSLVNQLAGNNAFGLISTHDLSLARETMKSNHVENYSFNSQVMGDEIIFDYKLARGICESFNASKLMEKIGIRLIPQGGKKS